MPGFFEKLKDAFDRFRDDLSGEEQDSSKLYEIQDSALIRGIKCVKDDEITALEPGTVEFINEQPDSVEIMMEDGSGYVLNFSLVKAGYELKVRPGQEVKTGQCLIRLEDGSKQFGMQVFAFTNEMLARLNALRKAHGLDLPDDLTI